jgi:hypothetical protein
MLRSGRADALTSPDGAEEDGGAGSLCDGDSLGEEGSLGDVGWAGEDGSTGGVISTGEDGSTGGVEVSSAGAGVWSVGVVDSELVDVGAGLDVSVSCASAEWASRVLLKVRAAASATALLATLLRVDADK